MLPQTIFGFCGEFDDGLEKLEENRIDGEFRFEVATARGKTFVTKLHSASCILGMSVLDDRSKANVITPRQALR